VADAPGADLIFKRPPGVAGELLQDDLIALPRRDRAVIVEQSEEARGAARRRGLR
jgi:hypothetical protein